MEIKYLITVKTILETGSFQNAARKLNYTQSTITFQIQQLEQELSVKLFEKIGRRMVLTQSGMDLMPYIDAALEAVQQITDFGKTASEMTGILKIALPESLLVYKIQPVLKAFRSYAPNVKLSLQVLNCYEIKDALSKGAIDVGIHYDVSKYSPSVLSETLSSFPLALVASSSLSVEQQDFTRLNQQKDVAIIGDSDSVYFELFRDYLKEKNISLNGSIIIQSIEAIKRSAASDLGIAFLPRFSVESELKEHALQELKTDLEDKKISAVISYHKNKWISPAMELFIRLIKESFI